MGSDSVRLRHYSLLGIVNITCPLDINKCPLGKQKRPFVHWTNRNVHWTFKCPFVHWTNRNAIGHSNVHSSIGQTEMSIGHKYMSIRPLDKWTNGHCLMASTLVCNPHGVRLSQITSLQLACTVNVTYPLDINKCPFVHWTNRNVHWTFKCPFVQWTNRNVHWTSKCPFVHWTNGRMDTV